MIRTFLRIGDEYLEESIPYNSKAAAVEAFRVEASSLARYGQNLTASIHYATNLDDLQECPDAILTLTKKGGVIVSKC